MQQQPPEPPHAPAFTHFCYALHMPGDPRGPTYVGYTVDPARRLRQHNGELRGGPRRTSRVGAGRRWAFLFVVACKFDGLLPSAAVFVAPCFMDAAWALLSELPAHVPVLPLDALLAAA